MNSTTPHPFFNLNLLPRPYILKPGVAHIHQKKLSAPPTPRLLRGSPLRSAPQSPLQSMSEEGRMTDEMQVKNEQYLVYHRMRYYTSLRVFPHAGIRISACIHVKWCKSSFGIYTLPLAFPHVEIHLS